MDFLSASPGSDALPGLAGGLGATTAMLLGTHLAPFTVHPGKAQLGTPGGDQGPATP